ncbi:C-type lectin domain family 2 member G-like protein [Cricetulus griseus]|uniref:C-type lectin domain family 2 member G-like protein n=1 Tax=Cricetulus griseus TaxID=10029 RepID=A0A061I1M6_CRIGR|nr:C-type lectin domain family 2 member G-like protein [Cricetulus griseus]
MELEAQLAIFENLEELNFTKIYNGTFNHWIGLHRDSPKHPWRWPDNTQYNSSNFIRGKGNHVYLSDRGISSGKDYLFRNYICSKAKISISQCQ